MRRPYPLLALALAACGRVVYTRAAVVYAEPPSYVYVAPIDRVVVVTREVLVTRGYVVYREEEDGPNRILWARRGDDEVVRVFATRDGERVVVRGLTERRELDDRRSGVDRRSRGNRRWGEGAVPVAGERRSSGERRSLGERRRAPRRSPTPRRLVVDRRAKGVAQRP